MTFGIIIILVSFFLDAFVSSYIPISISNYNLLVPMFTIISLIIILPYFKDDEGKYLITCLIFGILYDITFTNTFGLNASLFVGLGYVIMFLDGNLSNTLFSLIIKMIIVIILYDLVTYLILLLLNYIDYNILNLVIKIGKSLILNTIYLTLTYFITNKISKKFNIKKSI